MFLFKKKDIVLDCFTKNEGIIKTAPIVPAIKNTPEWWRDLPAYTEAPDVNYPVHTMKHCTGVVDYYAKSIALPLWSELQIEIDERNLYNWQFADMETVAHPHHANIQAPGFLSDYGHIKIISPWLFKTKEEISWVWSHPVYNFPDSNDIVSMPAVVNYKWQRSTNLNVFVNLKQPKKITLKPGQTMALMTPMSDRKVKVVRHLVSKEEFEQLFTGNRVFTFYNTYNSRKNLVEKFKECPFKKGL